MARKVAKRGTCAQCAADDVVLTVEHVFPESWYPDEYPPREMLVAPSCEPCNRRLGKAEERLFLTLVMMLPPDPRTASLSARAIRSVDVSAARDERDAQHRRKRGAALLRKLSLRGAGETEGALWTPHGHTLGSFVTEAGIQFEGAITAPIPPDDLEAVGIKMLRGCYHDHAGRVLPADSECWMTTFDRDPGDAWERVVRWPGAISGGAFPFEYTMLIDTRRPDVAAGAFVLWGAVHLFVAANLPKTRP